MVAFPEPEQTQADLVIEVGRCYHGGWSWTAYRRDLDRAWLGDDCPYETPIAALEAARLVALDMRRGG